MKNPACRFASVLALTLLIAGFAACTKDNPDEIRQRTADATAALRRDTKAVAEGVKEGMARDKTVDINKASRGDLSALPGISDHDADRIIAERPYDTTHDLVRKRIITEEQFDKIRDHITIGK